MPASNSASFKTKSGVGRRNLTKGSHPDKRSRGHKALTRSRNKSFSEEQIFGRIFADLGVGLNIISQDHVVKYQNKLLKDRFNDAEGKKCYRVYLGLDKPCDFCRIDEGTASAKAIRSEILAADGRDYELYCLPLMKKAGKAEVIGVLRDITDIKNLRSQLAHTERLSALGTLAGEMVHELNNIHTIIQGNVQVLLMQENLEPEFREDLQMISGSTCRASSIALKLLTLARKEKRKKELSSLEEIIKDTLGLIQKELESQGIRIKMCLDPDLPEIVVDPDQINQVIMNLLINAYQAMYDSREKFLLIETGTQDSRAFIRISDTGYGIPRENLAKIFKPFFTTKTSDNKASIPGTGLGLSVSQSMVQEHGGEIKVESKLGKGSSFTVLLPMSQEQDIKSRPVSKKPDKIKRLRVLVIDDEPLILRFIKQALEMKGYLVDTSASGLEGVRLAQQGDYHIVIVDIQIPDMQGDKTLAEINKIPPLIRPIKILTTGKPRIENIADYEKHGFSGVLFKPFHLTELYAVVEASIKGREQKAN